MPIVKGEVEWASVQAPNTQYAPCWCVDVVITEAQAKAITKESKTVESGGVKIKKDKGGRYIFKIRRNVEKSDGSGENDQPVVRDLHNRDLTCLVGNGSIANVQYDFYVWKNKFGTGVGVDFKGIQVLDLVPYGELDGEGFTDASSDEPKESSSDEFDDDDF